VTRNLRLAAFPPDPAETRCWFADHPREWQAGEAFRFAVTLDGGMIGLVDIDGIDWEERDGSLGYWLEPPAWGRGYASEAAGAVVRFAFAELGLARLRSGHAADNAASGRILHKLGFAPLDTVDRVSRPRGETIAQRRYVLRCPAG